MKTAIIIHGMPDENEYFDSNGECESNKHWIPWLQKQLNIKGILTQTPEMPDSYNPDCDKWEEVLSQFRVDLNTILIGHSCGAGFILEFLSRNNVKVNKVVLVAPWINSDKKENINMFKNFF